MFRMEFQALDAVIEEQDVEFSRSYRNEVAHGKGVHRHRTVESKGIPSRVYEGRVGKYGKMHRNASSKEVLHHLPKVLTRSINSSAASVSKNWVEVDLMDFGSSSKAVEEQATTVDQEVLKELVKPFAESVNLTHQPGGKRLDTDVFVTFLEYQPGQYGQLSGGVDFGSRVGSFRSVVERLPVRSNSMRSPSSMSWSDSSDAEGSNNYYGDNKGRPAARAYNRAFNKLMIHKNKNKPAVSDSKVAKPWEEPLLAGHEQLKLARKLQKEAKLEAIRQAEQAKRDAENQKREVLDLANPIPESALRNQKDSQYNMRKGIHKLFQISGSIHSTGHSPKEGDTRYSKLVLPRGGIFETCMSSSATNVALSHIRSAPRPAARRDIHFATVESSQRDVEAWTMKEYLAKNARIPECSSKVDDEEFGGIEGSQLLNRYFDDDVTDNLDSESD